MQSRREPRSERKLSEIDVFGTRAEEDLRQLRRRLAAAAAFLAALLVVGVVGYSTIDPSISWIDALYMTVITLTTVGYGEIVDLSGRPGGRLFTMALLLFGMGGVVYFVSTATVFVLEGALERVFWRHRMEKEIARLSGHLILCGDGPTALYAAAELQRVGRGFVVICENPDRVDRLRAELPGVPVLVGDPTADRTLQSAGIERAAGVIACADADKDNLLISLTARQLNPRARIVARMTDVEQAQKCSKVGADAVVSPHHIGGLRLASEMIRPTVVNFLDQMLRDRERNLRVDEVKLTESSTALGKRVGDIDFRAISNALLLACRTGEGRWVYNPPPDFALTPGVTLIVMGSPDDIQGIRQHLSVEPPQPAGPG